MAERNDISGMLGFIRRAEVWRERLQDAVVHHLIHALEELDLDHDDLADLLRGAMVRRALGSGFEDFLGRLYSNVNIVDLYLKRLGWKECPP